MRMDVVYIYGRPACAWCDRAVAMCKRVGQEFEYIDIFEDKTAKERIVQLGHSTVPVCYLGGLGGVLIGGYEELRTFVEKDA